MKRLNGVKKRRQKQDGLKRPKTPTQTHSQTYSQTRGQARGQTQIKAGLNAQKTHFELIMAFKKTHCFYFLKIQKN